MNEAKEAVRRAIALLTAMLSDPESEIGRSLLETTSREGSQAMMDLTQGLAGLGYLLLRDWSVATGETPNTWLQRVAAKMAEDDA